MHRAIILDIFGIVKRGREAVRQARSGPAVPRCQPWKGVLNVDTDKQCSRTVAYLEQCESKLFDRFMVECDEGRYYRAEQIVSLLKRLDVI